MDEIKNIDNLSDKELREALAAQDKVVGPITDSTRDLYKRILARDLKASKTTPKPASTKKNLYEDWKRGLVRNEIDSSSESTDEDFEVDGEQDDEDGYNVDDDNDDDDDEDDDDEYDEDDDYDDDDIDDDVDEDYDIDDDDDDDGEAEAKAKVEVKVKDKVEDKHITRHSFSASRFLRNMTIGLSLGFGLYYIYLTNKSTVPLKALTRQIIILASFSPILVGIYKFISYYRQTKHQETEKVYDLVDKILDHLQSPENPQLIPTLHIRDTLLSPSERKSPKSMATWSKAVKFIEENESRVMVELVNIDGEDFKAWKWIGARKRDQSI